MKLILFLEKIMPFKDSTIINIYSFLNKLVFAIVNIAAPIFFIGGLVTTISGAGEADELTILIYTMIIIVVLLVNISYRFNKILLNKLK